MLGLVFTEFVERVKASFSPELVDVVLQDAAASHGGAHTAAGHGPEGERQAQVAALSVPTGLFARHATRVGLEAQEKAAA